MALAIDTYIAAHAETVRRHQPAIRELSTPVIRVHDGVLLLPLVGAIDSLRAQQVMESVLARVADEQAQVIILDIAGVAGRRHEGRRQPREDDRRRPTARRARPSSRASAPR